jgi:NAD(P)-dependent dehydrogenase (short-subunit alcohol dehydrogenase family)
MTSGRFAGRVALVTGAAGGIGLATAERLAAEGAAVVAGVLDEAQRAATLAFDARVLDVTSVADWERVLADLEATHGGLDVLVNSAGLHLVGTAEETDPAGWHRLMEVNVFGTFLGCRQAIPLLRRRGGGAIVNLSSIAGHRGVVRSVAYAATKGAVLSMTLSLAADHVADGIRVNCVCPGFTDTAMVAGIAAQQADAGAFRRAMAERAPMGRMATAAEVAAAIAYLASEDAAYTTGTALPVDGGRSGR